MQDKPNYTLDKATADNMLNNILDNCNISPSSEVASTEIKRRSRQRSNIRVCKILAALFLVITVLAPLAFKRDPKFTIITSSKTVAVSSHNLYDDCFIMTLSGDADFDNIHAKKNDGAIIFPSIVEKDTGIVIIPYNGEALNIYIPTKTGECIQALLNETK